MPTELLPWITGAGGALVVLSLWVWAFSTGKIHTDREFSKLEKENASLTAAFQRMQETVAIERSAANESAQAGTVTNKILEAFIDMAAGRYQSREGLAAKDLGVSLTAKDLGIGPQ